MIIDDAFDVELERLSDIDVAYIEPDDLKRYRRLLEVQTGLFRQIADLPSGLQPVLPEKEHFEKGNPLVDPEKLAIDPDWAKQSVSETGLTLFQMMTDSEDFKTRCLKVFAAGRMEPASFLRWSLGGGRIDETVLASELGITREQIRLWGREAVRPWYWKLAHDASKIDMKDWEKGYCPVCGYKPELALLVGDEGFRHLVCGLCHHRWIFRRMQCPYCETIDETKLGYFYLEDNDPYRVSVCNNCKGYLKTIDTRKWPPLEDIYPRVQMVKTIYLDGMAENEGYTSYPNIEMT